MSEHASHEAAASPTMTPEHASRVRREVGWIFLLLVVFTGIELAVARSGAGHGKVIAALVLLATTKATLLGLFFMHLRHETRTLRWTVLGPLLATGLYGIVLAADSVWRALR